MVEACLQVLAHMPGFGSCQLSSPQSLATREVLLLGGNDR